MLKRFFALLLVLLSLKIGIAQSASLHDTLQQSASNPIIALYHQSLDKGSGLYNGREYIRYGAGYIGHPYFHTNDWQNGTIVYDGMTYNNVPTLYDMVKDELVIRHFNNISNINLIKEKLVRFNLAGHTFIRMDVDSTADFPLEPGFYDKLYDGNTMVLAKRFKHVKEYTITQQIETRFEQSNTYYIKRNNTYYFIKNAGALFSILKERKKETQQYLRRNKIKFRKNPESAIVKAAAYYDSLNK